MRAPVLAGLALVGLAVLLVPGVCAHAEYLRSEPDRGARLDEAPRWVTVVLTERVDPSGSGIEVQDAEGNPVHEGDVRLTNGNQPEFQVALPQDLPDGAYLVRWWAFSSVDQHTTSGTIGFAVGGFEPPASGQSSADSVDPRAAVARTIQYGGFALLFGALAFHYFIVQPGAAAPLRDSIRRTLAAGAVLQAGGLVALVAHTVGASGLGLAPFFAAEVGQLMALRLALAAILVAAAVWARAADTQAAWGLSLVLALAGALGSARFGHASQEGPWAIGVDFVHLVSVATWAGGLALLLWTIAHARRYDWDAPGVRMVGIRFSRVALTCVVALAASGLLTTLTILGRPSVDTYLDASGSSWGRALLAKIGLTVVMVALAGSNRYVFLDHPDWPGPPMVKAVQRWIHRATDGRAGRLHDAPTALAPARVQNFGRVVAVEACFGVAVVVLAGILTSVGAPYTGAAAPPETALRLTGDGQDFVGTLYLDPPPARGQFSHPRLYLADADGQPVPDNSCGRQGCLHLYVGTGNGSAGEEPHTLAPEGDGWWTTTDLLFVSAGPTTVRVEIQTAYVYLDELRFEFEVA